MKPPDLGTLIYIIAAISFLSALLMLIFYKANPSIKGPVWWSMGSFSALISALLFALFPVVGGYPAYVISGIFSVLTFLFYWAGFLTFKGQRVRFWIIVLFAGLQFLLGTLFYILKMPDSRMVAFSLIIIMVSAVNIFELLKPVKKPYRLGLLFCAVAFVVSALTSFFRILFILKTHPVLAHTPTQANLTVYFFTNMTQALLLFAFVLLLSAKISEVLKQKVEAQQKFFSVIAHDLRGPVGTLAQMLELVNHEHDFPVEEKRSILHEAEGLGNSTYHLLQNLLFWSKNQLEDLSPIICRFDMNKVIMENIEILSHISASKDISIIYEPLPETWGKADARMIGTVIRNLISNAVKFTPSGGRITITCSKSGKNLLVRILDNGIGMSQKVQQNLFKFNGSVTQAGTDGEKGTGLGLYLCKEFVEGNNGSLIIQSREHEGTEVVVSLPADY